MTEEEQVAEWKEQLPSDLQFGFFEADFDIDGQHFRYGAWNSAGDWWLAWNDDVGFQHELRACPERDEGE